MVGSERNQQLVGCSFEDLAQERGISGIDTALDLLVEQTGGQVFYPKEVIEVEAIAHQVAHDIRNQYSIAYTPTNPAQDGTFRTIKVTVKAPGNPVARTRAGYYAPKPKL